MLTGSLVNSAHHASLPPSLSLPRNQQIGGSSVPGVIVDLPLSLSSAMVISGDLDCVTQAIQRNERPESHLIYSPGFRLHRNQARLPEGVFLPLSLEFE